MCSRFKHRDVFIYFFGFSCPARTRAFASTAFIIIFIITTIHWQRFEALSPVYPGFFGRRIELQGEKKRGEREGLRRDGELRVAVILG